MAQKLLRTKMIVKLLYLLGPDIEELCREEREEPYIFSTAVHKVLSVYKIEYGTERYEQRKKELIDDYKKVIKLPNDSDSLLSSFKRVATYVPE